MVVAEPCYITDTERHLHKLDTALRNLYYATEQLCFEAEQSVISADLFVEMTLCSEQTATLIKSFSKTLLMRCISFCGAQKTKYAHVLQLAANDWRENPEETSRNRRIRSTIMKVSGNTLWTIGGRHVPGQVTMERLVPFRTMARAFVTTPDISETNSRCSETKAKTFCHPPKSLYTEIPTRYDSKLQSLKLRPVKWGWEVQTF